MDAEALRRSIRRLAHEVRERHPRLAGVTLAAIREGGVSIALLIAAELRRQGEEAGELLVLDISGHRDDRPRPAATPSPAVAGLSLDSGGGHPCAAPVTEGRTVVLIDDVLHTGRSLRAALDVVTERGRPAAVEPLVLLDRGQRELPLRATYVGRNVPVAADAWIEVVADAGQAPEAGAWLCRRR